MARAALHDIARAAQSAPRDNGTIGADDALRDETLRRPT
jgi:hypothetical protein